MPFSDLLFDNTSPKLDNETAIKRPKIGNYKMAASAASTNTWVNDLIYC